MLRKHCNRTSQVAESYVKRLQIKVKLVKLCTALTFIKHKVCKAPHLSCGDTKDISDEYNAQIALHVAERNC